MVRACFSGYLDAPMRERACGVPRVCGGGEAYTAPEKINELEKCPAIDAAQ